MRATLALLASMPIAASIRFPSHIASSMVVQRGSPFNLWGEDSPGATLTATFLGGSYTATAGADGVFNITLPAQPVTVAPATIAVSSSAGGTETLSDVLFGDVFVSSGACGEPASSRRLLISLSPARPIEHGAFRLVVLRLRAEGAGVGGARRDAAHRAGGDAARVLQRHHAAGQPHALAPVEPRLARQRGRHVGDRLLHRARAGARAPGRAHRRDSHILGRDSHGAVDAARCVHGVRGAGGGRHAADGWARPGLPNGGDPPGHRARAGPAVAALHAVERDGGAAPLAARQRLVLVRYLCSHPSVDARFFTLSLRFAPAGTRASPTWGRRASGDASPR